MKVARRSGNRASRLEKRETRRGEQETDERRTQSRQIEGIKSNHAHIYAADEQNGCVNRKNVTAREPCTQVSAFGRGVCNEREEREKERE